jgi:hypothetical protein
MLIVFVLLSIVCVGQLQDVGVTMSLAQQVEAIVGKPALVTGIANGFDSKGGALLVHGTEKDTIVFACAGWSDEVKKAHVTAEREDSDLWITMKVVIRVDPRWRADGKPSSQPSVVPYPTYKELPDKYYFSDEKIEKIEARKRQPNGSPAIVTEGPIKNDPQPPSPSRLKIPRYSLPEPNVRPQGLSIPKTSPAEPAPRIGEDGNGLLPGSAK